MVLLLTGLLEITFAKIYFARRNPERAQLAPDFICIGAQKAGTTWLDQAFRAHPEVAMPKGRKELHFFSRGQWKGEQWYLWHWRNSSSRVRGEVTPSYSLLDRQQLSRVYTLYPKIKIIFVLRNPIERAWSMAVMDLVKDPQIPYPKVPSAKFRSHFDSLGSKKRSEYSRIIKSLRSVFPKNKIGIFFYEDLCNDPELFWHDICDFLKIDPMKISNDDLIFERRNVGGLRVPTKHFNDLLKIYEDEILSLRSIIGDERINKWLEAKTPLVETGAEKSEGRPEAF